MKLIFFLVLSLSNLCFAQNKGSATSMSKNEMGIVLAECWFYWGYAQIAMIKNGNASSQQLANVRDKVELSSDLAIKLIGKDMATNYYVNLSRSYRARRDAGVDINPEIIKGSDRCNSFLDNRETVNVIKRMLN